VRAGSIRSGRCAWTEAARGLEHWQRPSHAGSPAQRHARAPSARASVGALPHIRPAACDTLLENALDKSAPPVRLTFRVGNERDDRRDRELLKDLAAGTPGALAELYEHHAASLLRHALALTRHRPDAEDLVHTAFIKVASTGAPLLGVRTPAAYLHRVLHAAWIDGRRRAHTGERVVAMAGVGAEWAEPVDGATIDLFQALDRLPGEQREAVVLHVTAGFSFREIGHMTGVSIFTAATRYRLAIGKLRTWLGGSQKATTT